MSRRQYVLGALLVALAAAAAFVLREVLATVFFAVTVAYLLVPVERRLVGYGRSRWTACLVATLAAFLAVLVALAPLFVVVLQRLDVALALLAAAPDEVRIDPFGFTYVVTLEQALAFVQSLLRTLARRAATAVPVLALKLSVFALVVFSLLYHQAAIRRAVLGVVPTDYQGVAEALHERIRETLVAIYVLQVATAVGTFLLALPVFVVLDYAYPFTLATVAAVLQFLPVIGPSVLVLALAAYHLLVGDVVAALTIAVVGSVVVAWLPDVLVRPRLARETTDLAGSLYFVGFVGGLLSLGAVGVIVGPLVIALVVEVAHLLEAELAGS